MYIKNEYDKQYKKDNYKQFKVYLKKEEKEELDDLLKEKNINASTFVRLSIEALKKDILKKEDEQ